ncbi:UNVERIFIED_CONTAM: putative mitochondrial protein [Sesamum indicum]
MILLLPTPFRLSLPLPSNIQLVHLQLLISGDHKGSHNHLLTSDKSLNDYWFFVKGSADSLVIVLVYVDDLLITGPSKLLINEIKQCSDDAFSIKDLGYATYFLGLEIARYPAGTWIGGSPPLLGVHLSEYILWSSTTESISSLAMPEPLECCTSSHAYLVDCPYLGLFLPASASSTLTAYCDADWGSCVDTRRFLSGYYIFLGDALVS